MSKKPMKDKEKICLFSGRFDRPHPGHITTIQDLGEQYKKVLVVILQHKEQKWPASYRAQVLKKILGRSKGNYEVIINTWHFGKIKQVDLFKYKFDVYAAGNMEVLKHIEEINKTVPGPRLKNKIEIVWTDRPYDYESNLDRLGMLLQEFNK
jgi:nicotinamide mononucleotide adenylyltransferase